MWRVAGWLAVASLCVVVADTWIQARAQLAASASWEFSDRTHRAHFARGPFWLTPDPWGLQ